MTLTDYMSQENQEEENLPALKIALMYRYVDLKKGAGENWLQKQHRHYKDQYNTTKLTRKQKYEEKQLYGHFKRQTTELTLEIT